MSTSLTGSSHSITLERAKNMMSSFKDKKTKVLKDEFQNKDIHPVSETFDRAVFDKVLAQPGCVGLRIYYGMGDDEMMRAIIVGVNTNNEDMLPKTPDPAKSQDGIMQAATDDDNTIIEDGRLCPPYCPAPSPLSP